MRLKIEVAHTLQPQNIQGWLLSLQPVGMGRVDTRLHKSLFERQTIIEFVGEITNIMRPIYG